MSFHPSCGLSPAVSPLSLSLHLNPGRSPLRPRLGCVGKSAGSEQMRFLVPKTPHPRRGKESGHLSESYTPNDQQLCSPVSAQETCARVHTEAARQRPRGLYSEKPRAGSDLSGHQRKREKAVWHVTQQNLPHRRGTDWTALRCGWTPTLRSAERPHARELTVSSHEDSRKGTFGKTETGLGAA